MVEFQFLSMPQTLPPALAQALQRLDRSKLPLSDADLGRTVEYAGKMYGDAMHWTGVSLLAHALGVLELLLPFQPDADTINACILQHALTRRVISTTELDEEFGPSVRALVSGVHLLSQVSMKSLGTSIEDLRLMLLTVSDDVRVLLIVLCDRCHVLSHSEALPAPDRRKAARDVLNLFAPVAARLGIHSLKQRLEGLAFPIVYPSDAEHIAHQLSLTHARHGAFLRDAAQALKEALKEQGIEASVQGREKQAYSIFMKMKSKSLSHIESLPDLFALRVIVDSEEDCYRALGVLHRLGRPVTNRFKDYISFPKPNGYQSLHTTVTKLPGVPEGVFVETQVRTMHMHREAEFGIAAHWSYKEGGTARQSVQRVQLQRALASQQTLEGTGEEATGTPRLADHIFVLTPKGDVIELPEGATTLDFAFQIHTDLGLSFRAARVNGSIVPLDYELENGDVVEVLTQRVAHPSPEWLQLLTMASSRSRLKRYLNTENRTEYITRGKEMLNEELRKRNLSALDAELSIMRRHEGRTLGYSEREDLLMKIGQGSDKVGSLLQRLDLLKPYRESAPSQASVRKKQPRLQRKDSIVQIEGNVPMPVRFAKCCAPKREDKPKLLGIIARGGDVMVHTAKCKNAKRGNPERRIGVSWVK
jgi:GTP pyrophosphokinase